VDAAAAGGAFPFAAVAMKGRNLASMCSLLCFRNFACLEHPSGKKK
jgi:hypothetical protein